MKIIRPAEISAKFMSLIEDAEKEVIIVSPYNCIHGWKKLINRINKAKSRGISITWYSRKNNTSLENSAQITEHFGLTPILIDNLHAKLYLNDTYAIVTSMNLSKVSDDMSIDIGYLTETKEEYTEVYEFYIKYVKSASELGNSQALITQKPAVSGAKNIAGIVSPEQKWIEQIVNHLNDNFDLSDYKILNAGSFEMKKLFNENSKISFEIYAYAIKTMIFIECDIQVKLLCKSIKEDYVKKDLFRPNELECIPFENGLIVKHYYRGAKDPNTWSKNIFENYLNNMDSLISIIFSKQGIT